MTDTTPTVDQAWNAVMRDVQSIRKGERNKAQGFNFRGIDTVMNAVGPVLREHGVTIIPTADEIITTSYETAKGTTMFSAIVKMRYTVRGPAGDSFDGGAYGEAADAGDKAVSKAQSVAYRVFLLQGLTIPTDDPDPDTESHQRAGRPQPAGSPAPAPTAPELSLAVTNFKRAANALTNEQKPRLRALLEHRGLPTRAVDMTDEQAAKGLIAVNEVKAGTDEAAAS